MLSYYSGEIGLFFLSIMDLLSLANSVCINSRDFFILSTISKRLSTTSLALLINESISGDYHLYLVIPGSIY